MKLKLFLLIATFFSVNLSFSQIKGFGKLKLGMTTSDIPELKDASIINKSSQYISKVHMNYTTNVYELIADTTDKYSYFGSYDKRVRVFWIGKYNLTDDISE